jgi:hypothetical protein
MVTERGKVVHPFAPLSPLLYSMYRRSVIIRPEQETMGDRVTIAGGPGKIVIEVFAYERRAAKNEDDANWLVTRVTVAVPPFSGSWDAAITTHELAIFQGELKIALASLSGTAKFRGMEGDLSLIIEFNKRGGAEVTGVSKPNGFLGTELHFDFETDQTFLKKTLQELEKVLQQFPVKKMT